MLRSFRVANHQSIRDEQELSLLPANDRDRVVVPVAAVFGANAAGKSSVVDVLRDWVQYVYGFTVDDEKVVDEWLYTYTKRRRRVVFERSQDHVDLGAAPAEDRAKGKLIVAMTRPNALFLSTAAASGLPDVMPVYEWFARGLAFLPTATPTLNATLLKRLMPGSPD